MIARTMIAAGLSLLLAGAAAPAVGATAKRPKAPLLIRSDYELPAPRGLAREDRWLLPDVADEYDPRETPRLRIRGKKVKLRVPLG